MPLQVRQQQASWLCERLHFRPDEKRSCRNSRGGKCHVQHVKRGLQSQWPKSIQPNKGHIHQEQQESGNVDLDVAINKYTEAMKLAKFCSEKLSDATKQVNKILTEDNELKEFNVE